MAFGAIASLGATIAGTFLSKRGAEAEGRASAASNAYQATVSRNNAALADKAADDAITRGKQAVTKRVIEGRQFRGQQRVAIAANGVVVDQGSASDAVFDNDLFTALDTEQIRENSVREAQGFEMQADNFREEANLLDQAGASALAAGRRRGLTSLVGGIGTVASKWYGFRSEGVL